MSQDAASFGKRKASQACIECRRKHSRCDGKDPCFECNLKQVKCSYSLEPKKKRGSFGLFSCCLFLMESSGITYYVETIKKLSGELEQYKYLKERLLLIIILICSTASQPTSYYGENIHSYPVGGNLILKQSMQSYLTVGVFPIQLMM